MEEKKVRVKKILKVLRGLFPEATTELNYSNPWELLVAVQLSAQTTDVQVNKVTEKLFNKYRNLSDYIAADPKSFEKDISSVNFFRNKAKNILAAARKVHEVYSDKVPESMTELLTLPGVARKTANVILGHAFKKAEGVVVDTHIKRLSQKLGLTMNTDPVKIEKDLMAIVPKEEWIFFSDGLVWYGRGVCKAKEHDCLNHPLTKIFPQAAAIWPKSN